MGISNRSLEFLSAMVPSFDNILILGDFNIRVLPLKAPGQRICKFIRVILFFYNVFLVQLMSVVIHLTLCYLWGSLLVV